VGVAGAMAMLWHFK